MINLLKNWDIGHIREIEPISSYWGNTSLVITKAGKYFILKEKKSLSQIKQEFILLTGLSNAGVPVAVPICSINGDNCLLVDGKTYCLYPKLPGKTIEEHYKGNVTTRAKSFGEAIAFLHSCLRKCENIGGIPNLNLVKQVQEWAIPCIRRNGEVIDEYTIEDIWSTFERRMMQLEDDLPKQLIHRDLHPANMLFENGRLTGFIDFDMVVIGFRIFDVCYCASSILVDGFKDFKKREKWLDIFHSLVSGYQEMCPLSSLELQAIPGTLTIIQLLFIAFNLETHAEDVAKCNVSVLDWLSKNMEHLPT